MRRCLRWRYEPLSYLGQRSAHGDLTGAYQIIGAREIVVGKSGNVGFHDDIRGASPDGSHCILRDGEGLSNDVEKMAWRPAVRPCAFQMDREHTIGSHFANWAAGYGVRQHSIHQISSVNLDGQKHSRIRTTGAHGIND